jgi:hypothetical protein
MGIDYVPPARTFGSLLCTIVVLAGCEGTSSDLIWIQQKTIALNGTDFESCVTLAVGEISGLSVEMYP